MALPSEFDNRFWLAILHELDAAGGTDTPSQVYPRMRQHFPEITNQDLQITTTTGGNKWTNMIQWARQHLVYRGCIDNSIHGKWVLSDTGRQWLHANWRGPTLDYSQVKKPPLLKPLTPRKAHPLTPAGPKPPGKSATATGVVVQGTLPQQTTLPSQQAGTGAQNPPGPTVPTLIAVLDPAAQLCQRLQSAQRQFDSYQQFEQALADAFTYLGFISRHIGGASEPDILVTALLGQSSYSVVVDAKSTHTGRVTDGQISWPVIDAYRQKHAATFAAVVGEDFSGGNLQTFANQYKVALITTGMICDLIKLHSDAPFSLPDLGDLFSGIGRADVGVQTLTERHHRNSRHWQLISEVVEIIDKSQRAGPGGTAHKVENLYYHLLLKNSDSPSTAPTLQDVTEAVAFLANRAVNILVDVPGSNGAYQLAMTATTARKRLLALARFFNDQATTSTRPVGVQPSVQNSIR